MLVHDRKTFCGVSLPNTAAALRADRGVVVTGAGSGIRRLAARSPSSETSASRQSSTRPSGRR
jgi:hypothetical protein